MTTITLDTPTPTGTLEDLVDRLLAALFPPAPAPVPSLAKTVRQARLLRQTGDPGGALAGIDTAKVAEAHLRWLYAEWLDIARRRFAGCGAMLYSPATGRAAALVPKGEGSLETVAVLGLRWPVGKRLSRRSLRGLKPLAKGGASWS